MLKIYLEFLDSEMFWVFLLKTKDSLSRKTNVDHGNARSGIEMCSHYVIYMPTQKPTHNYSEGFFFLPRALFSMTNSHNSKMCILDFVELSEYCHDQEFGIRHTCIQTPALSPMNCGARGKFYLNSQTSISSTVKWDLLQYLPHRVVVRIK